MALAQLLPLQGSHSMIRLQSSDEWLRSGQKAAKAFEDHVQEFVQNMKDGSITEEQVLSLINIHNIYIDNLKEWNKGRTAVRSQWLRSELGDDTLSIQLRFQEHNVAIIALGTALKELLDSRSSDTTALKEDGKVSVSRFVFTKEATAQVRNAVQNVLQTMVR